MSENTVISKGVPFNLSQNVSYAIGSVVSKTLMKKNVGNLTLFSFDKGQGLTEHTSPFDAVVHVIDGTAEIVIGGKPELVSAGEMIIMPAGVPHSLNAVERFKMLLIMIRGE
jgi:quercetin dioxygenase-like cupin family protein